MRSKQFIDKLRIFVKAGSGASGNPTVRAKGGDGGNVFLQVSKEQTLKKLLEMCPKKRFKAQHGMEASKRGGITVGHNGQDLIIPVPPGISVQLETKNITHPEMPISGARMKLLGNLDYPGQKLLVAKGGIGGLPQSGYVGTIGQAHNLILDLKLLADYSLIGFPNAGKSSLLKAVSGESVKIASYPFTTLRPQLAYCKYPDHRQISLIDLPGLADLYARYTGQFMAQYKDNNTSSEPINTDNSIPPLRHTNFLKHVERNSCILIVLDALGYCNDQYSSRRNPLAIAYLIMKILERWCDGILLEKPMVCVLNKIDLSDAMENALQTKYWLERMHSTEAKKASELPTELLPRYTPKFELIELVSAAYGTNIPELKAKLRDCLDEIQLSKCQQADEETPSSKDTFV